MRLRQFGSFIDPVLVSFFSYSIEYTLKLVRLECIHLSDSKIPKDSNNDDGSAKMDPR